MLLNRTQHLTVGLKAVLTEHPKVSDLLKGAPEVAARLEAATVWVNVHVADRLLDADAEAQAAPCEGVEDVHEVSIIWGQAPVGVLPLKVRTSWVQTCRHRINQSPVSSLYSLIIIDLMNRSHNVRCLSLLFILPVILPTLLVAWLPANPATWAPRL